MKKRSVVYLKPRFSHVLHKVWNPVLGPSQKVLSSRGRVPAGNSRPTPPCHPLQLMRKQSCPGWQGVSLSNTYPFILTLGLNCCLRGQGLSKNHLMKVLGTKTPRPPCDQGWEPSFRA